MPYRRNFGDIRRAIEKLTWLVNRAPDGDDTRVAEAMLDALMWVHGEGTRDANMVPEVLDEIEQLQSEFPKKRKRKQHDLATD